MKVMLFGASGMVGQGVLRECVLAPDVEQILLVGRSPVTTEASNVRQLIRSDLFNLIDAMETFRDYDVCLFCLGTSTSSSNEEQYRRINHDLPLSVADTLFHANPGMTFAYISGAGTDSSEKGSAMWARVKGSTENALQKIGFRRVYLLRPGIIVPRNGETSKTPAYRLMYQSLGWAFRLMQHLFPSSVLDTEQMGLAMLELVRNGPSESILDSAAIHRLAQQRSTRGDASPQR